MEKVKKKEFRFPSSAIILFMLVVLVMILTWVVPAGQFDKVMNEQIGAEVVDPGSFHSVEQSPVNPFKMFVAIAQGYIDGSPIIFLIIFGYFWVYSVMQTGAFGAMINKLLNSRMRDSRLFIPAVMLVFALAGSTYGEFETVYGLIPIFIGLAIALGYDAIVGFCISGMAVAIGFASATTNPFTIGIAQNYSNLPMFSGLLYRWLIFAVFVSLGIVWVMRYAAKVKRDPSKSLVKGLDFSTFDLVNADLGKDTETFTTKHKVLMLGMVVTVGVIVFGSLKLNWYLNEMTGVFMISGIISCLIAGNGPEKIVENVFHAFKEMVIAIVVIGLSRAVLVILSDGQIVDSIIYHMYNAMSGLPKWAMAEMMLIMQNVLNFFIPGGAGQAIATMPIMAPVADLAGINRQVAVLAFQFGDGFSNLLWPTGCAVMCGIAKIPLDRWYKFFLPLFGIIFVLESVFMIGAILIGYGPY